MSRIALAAALALAITGVGCGMAPPPVTAADAARANVALEDLQHGRSLLMSKCGGCHRPPLPAERRPAEWPREVDEMANRAKLDISQRQLIATYLTTMTTR